MNLREWLTSKEYSPEEALCVSIGTDGLSLDRNNLMSVSFCGRGLEPVTIYIDGADCEATYKYTGLDCVHYDAHKVGIERAVELLSEQMQGFSYVVGYQCVKWLKPWLQMHLPELFAKAEFLDIIEVIQLSDMGRELPLTVDTLDKLLPRVHGALVGSSMLSFPIACSRFLAEEEEAEIELEDKARRLYDLYTYVVTRG